MFFKVKPEIENAPNPFENYNIVNVVFEDETFKVQDKYSFYGQNNITIIQGQVGYPVSTSILKDKISNENVNFLQQIQNAYITIEFNIGEIGVTASREGIEYDKATCENIEKRVSELRLKLKEMTDEKIKNIDTEWGKGVFFNENSCLSKYADFILTSKIEKRYGEYRFNFNNVKEKGIKVVNPLVRSSDRYHTIYLNCTDKLTILVHDQTKLSSKKRKHFVDEILDNTHKFLELKANPFVLTEKLIEEIKTEMGGFSNFVFLSSIELPVVEKKSKPKAKGVPVSYCSYNGELHENTRKWKNELGDFTKITDQVLYATVDRIGMKIIDFEMLRNCSQMPEYKYYKVIVIREKDEDKVSHLSNFTSVTEFIAARKKEYENDRALIRRLYRYEAFKIKEHEFMYSSKFETLHAAVTQKSKLKKVLELHNLYKQKSQELTGDDFCKKPFVQGVIDKFGDKYRLTTKLKKYVDQQPLLENYIETYSRDNIGVESLVQYLLAYEKARKLNLI